MHRIKIGWASRDVSTCKPVNMSGQFHMRIIRGVLDPITVTALVVENSGDIAVPLVQCERASKAGCLTCENGGRDHAQHVPGIALGGGTASAGDDVDRLFVVKGAVGNLVKEIAAVKVADRADRVLKVAERVL